VIPPGFVVLDIDNDKWEERLDAVKAICIKHGLFPPIHKTNKGVHVFFKTSVNIPGDSKGTTKAGFKVTYRAGGKNLLILAPENNRTWEIPLNGSLPEIPVELRPFEAGNKEDIINVFAVQLGDAIRADLLSGYEDIDLAFMSFLIEAGINKGQVLRAFEKVYQSKYDERLTSQMYERAEGRIKGGDKVRGAGSFIFALKEKGLDELIRLAQKISGNSASHNAEWTDPIPFNDYSTLPDFPLDVLSGPGRQMIEEVSEVTQVDPGMTASIYLAVLSACLAKKGAVDLISHREPLNLYTCSILPSGNRKSSTMALMTGPLYEYQAKRQEAMQGTIREALNAHRIREARLAKLQKQAANADKLEDRRITEMAAAETAREISENPVPPTPLYIVDDITTEALGIHMTESNERMAVMSTEGGIFGIMAGRYSDRGGNFDLYLKGHSGDAWSSHRVGRDAKTMQFPALTMCLTVQPEVIRGIGNNKQFVGLGLLARFLYSQCESQVGYRSRQTKSVSASTVAAYQRQIENLMDIPMTFSNIKLSPDAQPVWDEFYNDIETDQREGCSLHYLTDWGSKLPGAVARIAGLLHFAQHGAKAIDLPISVNIVSASCVIGIYFKEHAVATFGLMEADLALESAKKILSYLLRHSPETFKGRDVLRHTNFKTMDEVSPGLKLLIERGYIRAMEPIQSGIGRPEAMTYEVNQKIKTLEKP
jgi:hypothetical protein